MGHSQFGRNEIKEVLLYMNYKNIFTNGWYIYFISMIKHKI
jgi:hypothetical protein